LQAKARRRRFARLRLRMHARRAARLRLDGEFVAPPEPLTIGTVPRGLELMAGRFLLAGHYVNAPQTAPWDLPAAQPAFEMALHGFEWLDDLAALGDDDARQTAQTWTFEWLTRFGRGRGPGWEPELAARRLTRWINHALLLLDGVDSDRRRRFMRALMQHAVFVARTWPLASGPEARIEAVAGLIQAALQLEGMGHHAAPACVALGRQCDAHIDAAGGIVTRNPEVLLEVFTQLTRAASVLSQAGVTVAPPHVSAIERIAPTLRALRHADGGLARFHGGGRGAEGRLDHALAASGVRGTRQSGAAMGFARLSGGRTSVIVDAAPPPPTAVSHAAHASTLAFELTSARRPVIVNCGAGHPFGPEWARAGRATPSHSTLGIEGVSSSRLGSGGLLGGAEMPPLTDRPRHVGVERLSEGYATALRLSHDGYRPTHGLTHLRRLDLSADGRALMGEDTLGAMSAADRKLFARVVAATRLRGVRFMIRFHLHPDVEAALDPDGRSVRLDLRSGEVWHFRHEGDAALSLEPSVYLQRGRVRPRATSQIVLTGIVAEYPGQANWTFEKAAATPIATRDVAHEDIPIEA